MEISDEEEQLESRAASQNVDLDNASVGSSASVSRRVFDAWHSLEPVNTFSLPWETGFWKGFFDNSPVLETPSFDRPFNLLDPFDVEDVLEEPPSKKTKLAAKPISKWMDVVRDIEEVTWQEEREAKRQIGLKRWCEILKGLSPALGTVQDLLSLETTAAQLRMIQDLVTDRAPDTLVKRANSFQRCLTLLDQNKKKFPPSRMDMYHSLSKERSLGAPASRLQGIMESLRFAEHILGLTELHEITTSPLCNGVCKKFEGGGKRQASPFLVSELRELHRILESVDEDIWCRYFAGSVLLAVYSRSRWSDLQHGQRLILDYDTVDDVKTLAFLEIHVFNHKTRKSTAFRNAFLPAIAPGRGVNEDQWASTWVSLREQLEMGLELIFPVMPAPTSQGTPSKRPLSTEEMKKWLNWLLDRDQLDDGRRLTSHSCKATCLSYLSKHGASWEDRAVLGGHCMGHSSTITYSRDAMARPLMVLEGMLSDVRRNVFLPDATRSGRFVKSSDTGERPQDDSFLKAWRHASQGQADLPPEPSSKSAGVATGDSWEEVEKELEIMESGDLHQDEALDDVSLEQGYESESSYATTSSSSDSEGGLENPAKRMARPPVAPAGLTIHQNPKTKMLHLMEEGNRRVLLCGRVVGVGYHTPTSIRYDTPCCTWCWRKSKRD